MALRYVRTLEQALDQVLGRAQPNLPLEQTCPKLRRQPTDTPAGLGTIPQVAFAGTRHLATGALRDLLPVLKERFDRNRSDLVFVFEVETGRQVDFDLRGSLDEVLEREAPTPSRGPGRPKLGVTSREVSLLPRHWDWLEQQSNGISGALRRLVEQAIKSQPGRERARRIRAAVSRFLSSMSGDRPHYEEATRALFNGDVVAFEGLVRRWPKDIRDYALQKAREAAHAEEGLPDPASLVSNLYRLVWNEREYSAIERLVAPQYVIHSDPGDPWEGETLDRREYEERVDYSRDAFPELAFTVHEAVSAGDRSRRCALECRRDTRRGPARAPRNGEATSICRADDLRSEKWPVSGALAGRRSSRVHPATPIAQPAGTQLFLFQSPARLPLARVGRNPTSLGAHRGAGVDRSLGCESKSQNYVAKTGAGDPT